MMTLKDCLMHSQSQLFRLLMRHYRGNCVSRKGAYILVQGEAPVLLVAHLDTVHNEPVRTICKSEDGNILMSPQGIGGDDRCGVFALQSIYAAAKKKPWLLFTCDEETGGEGAKVFVREYVQNKLPAGLDKLKMLIEIDRKGSNDAVFYGCDNPDFEEYINKHGFKTQSGSFSDISLLAPAMGVAAVNLSSGYYNAHSLHETINLRHLEKTISRVSKMVEDAACDDFPCYEYIESAWNSGWRYEGLYDADIPKSLPKEYRQQYSILLDYYTKQELENYRRIYGDGVLQTLYEDIYGYYLEE